MKKIISLILVMSMMLTVFSVSFNAAFSVSDKDANGNILIPSAKDALAAYEAETGKEVATKRIYFQMPDGSRGAAAAEDHYVTFPDYVETTDPNSGETYTEFVGYHDELVMLAGAKAPSWYNEYNELDGQHYPACYWWSGTCNPEEASLGWCGYRAEIADYEQGIYYVDIPEDVSTIVWNNGVNGGTDSSDPIYYKAAQTANVNIEGAWVGDYDSLPYGSPDSDFFDNCIYVIDPDQIDVNPYSSKLTCNGNWYVYYGNGCYGQEYAEGCGYECEYPDGTPDWTDNTADICLNPDHWVGGVGTGTHVGGQGGEVAIPTEEPEVPTEVPQIPTVAPTMAPTEAHEYQYSFLFTDNFGWGTAYVYAWDADGNPLLGEWPGSAQTETVINDYGETEFRCYVPAGAAGVIVNNGSGAQTEDITDFTYKGFYMNGSRDSMGHYRVTGWGHQEINEPTEEPEYPTEEPEVPTEVPQIPTVAPTMAPTEAHEYQYSFLFTDNFGWGTAYVYAWDADGNPLLGEWPGSAQTETVINDYGETEFRCYVPAGAAGVIVNNGSGAQTEDITDFTYKGFYMNGSRDSMGHYRVTGWGHQEINEPTEEPEYPTEEPEYPTEVPADNSGYYLVGTMTDWAVDSSYKLTPVEGTYGSEYSISLDLYASDMFKIVYSEDGFSAVEWYPDGVDDNYGQYGEIPYDGSYTVYFRPDYDGGEDWFYNCIYVSLDEPFEYPTEAPEEPTEEPYFPVIDDCVVAGNTTDIFGTAWNCNDVDNLMDSVDGVLYYKEYTVDQAYTDIQLKVVKNYANWYGDANGNNVTFNLTGAGTFTVYYDDDAEVAWVEGDIVNTPNAFAYQYVCAVGNGCGLSWMNGAVWDPSENMMDGDPTLGIWSYESTIEEGDPSDVEFKFTVDGEWLDNFGLGYGDTIQNGVETDAVYDGENIFIYDLEPGTIVSMELDLSVFDYMTKTGARMTINWIAPSNPTEAPTEAPTAAPTEAPASILDLEDLEARMADYDGEIARVYFMMPNGHNGDLGSDGNPAASWYNDYNLDADGMHYAGFYSWHGEVNPDNWPGFKMSVDSYDEGVYYVDIPGDDGTVNGIFNNGINGGVDSSQDVYYHAAQASDLNFEGAWEGDYDTLPDGSYNEMDFDGCIFVVDPDQIDVSPLSGKQTCGGNWYYYYGNGCYGSVKDNADPETDCLNPYHHHGAEAPTIEPTAAPTEAPTQAPTIEPTEAPADNSGYYLVGSMNDWTVDSSYKLTPVEGTYGSEYSISLDLYASDQFKIVYYADGDYTWYPDGVDDNYGQYGEIPYDGSYTVYFRPEYNGNEDWFYGCIYVAADEPEYPTEEPYYPTVAPTEAPASILDLEDLEARMADYDGEIARVYFMMPNGHNGDLGSDGNPAASWYNDYNLDADGMHYAGFYSWHGEVNPDNWPGFKMSVDSYDEGVYYVDIPGDDGTVNGIFNNGINGGVDSSQDVYYHAAQASDLNFEGAWEGDYDTLPDGSYNEMDFDGCIFVVDPDQIDVSPLSGKQTCGGNWYYYYGNGCYGSVKDNADPETDCLNPYHHHGAEAPTEVPTEAPEEPTEAPASGILGDVNGDDSVDIVDATCILSYLAHVRSLTGGEYQAVDPDSIEFLRADVDGSGNIEITDATFIQRYLARLDTPWPIGQAL